GLLGATNLAGHLGSASPGHPPAGNPPVAQAPRVVAPAAKERPVAKKADIRKLFKNTNEVYLSDLDGFEIEDGPWGVQTDGLLPQGTAWTPRQDIKVNGQPSPHGISMHPPDSPNYCRVSFRLDKQARRLQATVGLDDTSRSTAS